MLVGKCSLVVLRCNRTAQSHNVRAKINAQIENWRWEMNGKSLFLMKSIQFRQMNVFLFTHLTMHALHYVMVVEYGSGSIQWWYDNDGQQHSSLEPVYKLMTYLFHIFFSSPCYICRTTSGSGERAQWHTEGNLLIRTTINTHINSYCYCLSPWMEKTDEERKKKMRSKSKSNVINAPKTWITSCDWYENASTHHTG